MAFLEEEQGITTLGTRNLFAVDYEKRYPYTE
jgi:hypothetical protein